MKTIDIEVAVMKYANIRQNIVVPNVSWGIVRYLENSHDLLHECDVLSVTPSGYATEYEIKISKSDFKADAKKKHSHDSRFIKQLYYVVPESMLQFAIDNMYENAGLAYVREYQDRRFLIIHTIAPIRKDCFKWTNEELFKLAKLGCMRIFGLKNKLSNY